MSIIDSRHPDYSTAYNDWVKWRLAYNRGWDFINTYLQKFSSREDDTEFLARKQQAYVPGFAAAAIDEVRNAIFQRASDVSRAGGPVSYIGAVDGKNKGVDYEDSTMGTFIGTEILSDLLVLGKVGVLVDQHADLGTTLAEKGDKHPYISQYMAEEILNWNWAAGVGFKSLLLQETIDEVNEYDLPDVQVKRYRYMRLVSDGVQVIFFNEDGHQTEETTLPIPTIPFTVFEVPVSLMLDTADYQIALLNKESSDMSYLTKANWPFYYEFFDPTFEPSHFKPAAQPGNTGTAAENQKSKDRETRAGLTKGRRFPKGTEAPGYIGPDPEILRVSVEKGREMKEDIRRLINLNLSNMDPRRQSSESKEHDDRGLEAGLSYIGLILERGETSIANHWRNFENEGEDPKITYPKTYNLRTEEERHATAGKLTDLSKHVPSITFKKRLARKIARIVVGGDVSRDELQTIEREIEKANYAITDVTQILGAHKQALVSGVTASNAIGFNGETEVPIAEEERAKRIAETLTAQGGEMNEARGMPEAGGKSGVDEKEGKDGRGTSQNKSG